MSKQDKDSVSPSKKNKKESIKHEPIYDADEANSDEERK